MPRRWLAAATIAADIDRRWVMLERAAERQELIKALTQLDEAVDVKEARNAVFLRLKSEAGRSRCEFHEADRF